MSLLLEIFVFLLATIVVVPVCRKFGLSTVLGYLLAGLLVGPSGLGLISNSAEVLHFAEFGIVLLLFIIGLELRPRRLWTMRRLLLGLGAVQIFLTSIVIAAFSFMLLGLSPPASVLIGFSLALSSTAFVLQLLGEQKKLTKPHGRAAFGTLLMQDVAVIPAIAVVAVLSAETGESTWINPLLLAGVVGGLVVARFTLRPALHFVAATGIHELFTAAALALVVGAALAMHSAGLSMGLGAFIAGVMVADSEYRHQLEADVMPFKGLLLGLFFIAVGMSTNLRLLIELPFLIAGLTAALMVAKSLVIYPLARAQGLGHGEAVQTGLVLAQGGEFAFVLFTAGVGAALIDRATADIAVLVVTLSMAATPVLTTLGARFAPKDPDIPHEETDGEPRENHVIIAGFGPFGQTVARVLATLKIPFTAIELDPGRVRLVRQFGSKIYYGDASRLQVLLSARADRAVAIVIAVEDVETSLKIANQVRRSFPNVKIMARAADPFHEIRLREAGAGYVIRETLLSSLALSEKLLEHLGMSPGEAARITREFRKHDSQTPESRTAVYQDEAKFRRSVPDAVEDLKNLLKKDKKTGPRTE